MALVRADQELETVMAGLAMSAKPFF